MVSAIETGQINVGLTWDPAVGYFLKAHPDLTAVIIPNSRSQGSPEQYSFPMAMATRSNDEELHAAVKHVIATHLSAIRGYFARVQHSILRPPEEPNDGS